MSSGYKYEVDPKNAGYELNQEQPPNPYNAGYNQPPTFGQQQPVGYGYPNTNTSTNVVVTSAPTAVVVPAPRGNDWLVPAILSCFFCFWPTGICAIVAAVNARARFDVGDYQGGRSSASWARGLTLTSLGIGLICVILIIVLYVVALKESEKELNRFTTMSPWNSNWN